MDAPINDWLEQYREGDAEALGRLVEHFRRPLFGFLLKMTEGRGDVDELFQEVWFRAIKNLDRYADRNFMGWLFRIAHNLVTDQARRNIVRKTVDDDPEHPVEARLPDPSPGPDRQTDGRDLGHRIQAALARLPVEQREVFAMRMEGDLPFKEIARIQGVSLNTALGRMHYALGFLRHALKDDYANALR